MFSHQISFSSTADKKKKKEKEKEIEITHCSQDSVALEQCKKQIEIQKINKHTSLVPGLELTAQLM
jgi:hypothetical protein